MVVPSQPISPSVGGEALFHRSPREGGYQFVVCPKFPGFSFMLRPAEDDTALNAAFVSFIAAEVAIPAPDEALREALEAFAKTADAYEASHDRANKALEDEASCEKTTPVLRPPLSDTCRVSVTLGDCRIARATLQRVHVSLDRALVKEHK